MTCGKIPVNESQKNIQSTCTHDFLVNENDEGMMAR